MTQNLIHACLVGVYWLGRNPRDRWHLLPDQETYFLEENLILIDAETGIELTASGFAMIASRIV
jgi:hypothetical protein